MRKREITLDCGLRQLMHAREELGRLSGVVGVEVITGKNALRVWQGDELGEGALYDALARCGLTAAQIHAGR